MNDDAIDAAYEMAAILESLKVPYMIGGSMASTLLGEPRFTLDVDFVAALEGRNITPYMDALKSDWYADAGAIQEGRLDEDYLSQWAARMELSDLLALARQKP